MDAFLSLLRNASKSQTLDRLHAVIEREIAVASQRIDEGALRGDEWYLDAVTDDECELIEELLGLAFVAAQTFMTGFRNRLSALADACQSDLGHSLSFVTGPKAYDVFKIANPIRADSRYTEIEAINAVANYWKHSEEWPTGEEKKGKRLVMVWDTAKMRGNEKRTVDIVASIGMSPSSTGNLRDAARMLGVTTYEDISPIRQKLRHWGNNVCEKARLEVSQLNVSTMRKARAKAG